MNTFIGIFIVLFGVSAAARSFPTISIPKVCEASDIEDALGISPSMCDLGPDWKTKVTSASYVDVYQDVTQCKRSKPFFYTNMPWLLMRSPRLEVRRVAYTIQEELTSQVIKQVSNSQTPYKLLLAESAKRAAVYTDQVEQVVTDVVTRADSNESMNAYLREAEAYTPQLCLIFADPGCAATLKDAFEMSRVISLYNKKIDMQISLTMVDEAKRLFTESHFSRGLSIAALRISGLALDAQKGNLPKTHLLDDLVTAFEEAGYDQRSALDLSFTFLAFYGTRGASMVSAIDLVTPENQSVMLSSMMIAASLGVLDAVTLPSTHPYSLPPTVTTSCTYGAPYHFWMPAALAWQLVRKNHSARSSMIAAHILGVGYEALATTVDREPWDELTISAMSISNNGVRINIAMNDAGAKFGSEIATEKRISHSNIDARITMLMNSANKLPALTNDQASKLFENKFLFISRWLLIFMPNAGF